MHQCFPSTVFSVPSDETTLNQVQLYFYLDTVFLYLEGFEFFHVTVIFFSSSGFVALKIGHQNNLCKNSINWVNKATVTVFYFLPTYATFTKLN